MDLYVILTTVKFYWF